MTAVFWNASPELAFAMAGGAAVLRKAKRQSPIARTLGFYIAGCAGSIQLLDVVVDRLDLPERLLVTAIILAVIGLPVIAAATALLHAAAEEKRPSRSRAHVQAAPARSRDADVPLPAARRDRSALTPALSLSRHDSSSRGSSAPAAASLRSDGLVQDPMPPQHESLTRRVELALSFYRIAELQHHRGSEATQPHLDAFISEAEAAAAELNALIAQARSLRGGTQGGATGE